MFYKNFGVFYCTMCRNCVMYILFLVALLLLNNKKAACKVIRKVLVKYKGYN